MELPPDVGNCTTVECGIGVSADILRYFKKLVRDFIDFIAEYWYRYR